VTEQGAAHPLLVTLLVFPEMMRDELDCDEFDEFDEFDESGSVMLRGKDRKNDGAEFVAATLIRSTLDAFKDAGTAVIR
jgi:hypothetical protein